MHKKIYIYASAAFILLCAVLLPLDPSVKAFHVSDITAPFWYYITITGNFMPEVVIIFFLYFAVLLMNKTSQRRFLSSALLVLVIAVSASATAFVANFVLKDMFHTARPSHKIFLEDGFIPSGLDSFYLKSNTFRREYIRKHVDPTDAKLSEYYPPAVSVWMNEVGESFPSGHALNSFLIGTLFSYLLLYYLKTRLKYLFAIPLLWALLVSLSRYLVGVHEKIDIIGGALIGMSLAFLVIGLKIFDRIDNKFLIPIKPLE